MTPSMINDMKNTINTIATPRFPDIIPFFT